MLASLQEQCNICESTVDRYKISAMDLAMNSWAMASRTFRRSAGFFLTVTGRIYIYIDLSIYIHTYIYIYISVSWTLLFPAPVTATLQEDESHSCLQSFAMRSRPHTSCGLADPPAKLGWAKPFRKAARPLSSKLQPTNILGPS